MEMFDANKLAQDAVNEIKKKIQNMNHLNIIVVGKTGVGKSTLINAVFRDKLAETGMGKPVTDHMRKLTKKGVPLSIYDTRGFELGKAVQDEVKKEIMDTISEGLAAKDIKSAIHCIWYCINTASNRVEPEEIEWIKEFAKENKVTQVPVIIVLTQSFSKKNAQMMRTSLLNENLDVVQIVPVLAEDYEIDEEYTAKSYGLDSLIRIMGEALPDELVDTLQHVQIASLEEKKKRAHAIVAASVVATAAEGAIPISGSDAMLMVPTQLAMIASITVVFGFDVSKSILTAFLSSTLGTGAATIAGKTIVANILKWIPGVGQVVGGTISAATAGVITAALGEAYIGIMSLVFSGEMNIEDLDTDEGKDKMSQLFIENLSKKR